MTEVSLKPRVYIANGSGPYRNTIKALRHFDFSFLNGKKVLLKPNAGRIAPPEKGITTHPEVIAAAIDFFTGAGACVAIGESPISGVKTMEAFKATGIAAAAETRNCRLIDMDARKPRLVRIPDGKAISSVHICADIFDFDFIVSVPVIKTHMHTGVTLSVKNMKGCLWGRTKVAFHMLPEIEGSLEKSIDVAIADLSSVLKPDFVIIDGTVCMQGLGPSAGSVKPIDTVIAGFDAFAADAITCRLIGIDPEKIPHLKIGAARNGRSLNTSDIDIEPGDWAKLKVKFERPPENITIHFPGIEVFDKNSCSACQSSLFLFLKNYGKMIMKYTKDGSKMKFAIGKGHKNLPEGTFCVGNCVRNCSIDDYFIPGCPPVSSEILRKITGEQLFDEMDGKQEGKLEIRN